MLRWGKLGVSGETNYLQLYYEPISKSIIAQFYKGLEQGYGVKNLWMKGTQDNCYKKLTNGKETYSFEDPVLSPIEPVVYVNVLKIQVMEDGSYDGYEWDSILEYDLRTMESKTVLKNSDIELSPPYYHAWVNTLYGVDNDGRALNCSIAHQKRTDTMVSEIEYFLCSLNIESGTYTTITKLKAGYL